MTRQGQGQGQGLANWSLMILDDKDFPQGLSTRLGAVTMKNGLLTL